MTDNKELELYIHIPFCVKKCDYCDFLSYGRRDTEALFSTCVCGYTGARADMIYRRYAKSLIKEIEGKCYKYHGFTVVSVFIGGGTPSILPEGEINGIMTTVKNCFSLAEDVEITIEANPGTLTREKLIEYKNSGINRLSMGLQSANNNELKTLGRVHTYEVFLKNYKLAREVGFTNINVDLMGSIPGQNLESFTISLEKVIELSPEHISSYELIIEEGTPFYSRYNDNADDLPSEDEEREIYYRTRELLEANGYKQYEISNYAKASYECKHNIGYWTGRSYLGFGLGASSYDKDTVRYKNTSEMGLYIKGDYSKYEETSLDMNDNMGEFMFLGLRMNSGVSAEEFENRFGQDMFDVYGDVIQKNVGLGLLSRDGDRIKLTKLGMDVANRVMSEFV